MTDDLRPKSHLGAIIITALTVGGSVWAASEWLHNRASSDDVKTITNNSFQQRLDLEVIKGEMKAFNIRLERIEKATDAAQEKPDDGHKRRR